MSDEAHRYSMIIEWSDEDGAYVVTLPEFSGCHTHGESYEAAAKHGREVIELLIETMQADGKPLPSPKLYIPANTLAS